VNCKSPASTCPGIETDGEKPAARWPGRFSVFARQGGMTNLSVSIRVHLWLNLPRNYGF